MRRAFFFCLLSFFAAAPAAFAQGCLPYEAPIVNVRPLKTTPQFDNTRSLDEIRVMASQGPEQYSSTRHEVPVGLTAASLLLNSRFEVLTHSRPGERTVCAQVSRFDLSFGFDDTIVYLARELPYGSCSYNTVLEHESRHVGIDQALVDLYAPQLPGLLRQALRDIGVVQAFSASAAEEQIRAAVKKYTGELGAHLSEIRSRQQAQIDTQDEYSRLSQNCDGALSRLIDGAAR